MRMWLLALTSAKSTDQTRITSQENRCKFAKPERVYGLAEGGQTDRFASSHKSQKAVNFTHIQLTCNQLVSTCVEWPNSEKCASTWVRIWLRPNLTRVIVRRSVQIGGQTKSMSTQVENVRIRLARFFGAKEGNVSEKCFKKDLKHNE